MTRIAITGRYYYAEARNPSPALTTNPRGFVYSPTSPRKMYTIAQPRIEYSFQAPPSQFELEGFGPEINEIKRPYSLPIADIYGGKLRRLSFEFAVIQKISASTTTTRRPDRFALSQTTQEFLEANPNAPRPLFTDAVTSFSYYDGMTNSIETQLERLQLIVDTGIPVGFENMSPHIQAYSWFVDDMKWSITRDDASGNAVAATCSMSFIEFRPTRQRFILMPRMAYGVPAASVKKGAKDKSGGNSTLSTEKYLNDVFRIKVRDAIKAGTIRYPFDKTSLQQLLDASTKADNQPYFTIPEEWIKELRDTHERSRGRRGTSQ